MNLRQLRFSEIRTTLALALLVCLLVFIVPKSMRMRAGELFMLTISPSAERAYEYGELRFNASQHNVFDVEYAEEYFLKAVALNPKTSNVFHELARISFLKGDFDAALAKINVQISLTGDNLPNSYYIRGLIEGYMGSYTEAAIDYRRYLEFDARNWAAINDLAWVLLKAERYTEAEQVTSQGVAFFPNNPWLYNSRAIALYELGRIEEATNAIRKARIDIDAITESDWLVAYPGNDPKIASDGVAAFRSAVENNMHMICPQVCGGTVQ